MTENFAELFEESLIEIDMTPGAIVSGTVIEIDSDWVTVHAGLKSEGVIPRIEFLDEQGNLALEIGDVVKVALE
ncbi:MAG TPA: 30S ribosomal protein S1, partial [Gammaproteobacteria bacterium]|nr:30S ribosomal protein S1 [Gammaproteobacteria bacterium]